MICWYVKTERLVEAFKMFRTMMRMGIRLSLVSFVNVSSAVWRMNDYGNANVLYCLVVKLSSDYADNSNCNTMGLWLLFPKQSFYGAYLPPNIYYI